MTRSSPPIADAVYNASLAPTTPSAWIGVFAFSGQIMSDFAGYSTCALGMAACLGFVLPENFNYPYAAFGFADFWQRWHITLSRWLRDYLYMPMILRNRRVYLDLFFTMLVAGLWHGPSWTFVVFGALHGLYLVAERLVRGRPEPPPIGRPQQIAYAFFTFVVVSVTGSFFRAKTFAAAISLLRALCGRSGDGKTFSVSPYQALSGIVVVTAMLLLQWALRDRPLAELVERRRWWGRSIILATMMISIVLCTSETDYLFIYFRF